MKMIKVLLIVSALCVIRFNVSAQNVWGLGFKNRNILSDNYDSTITTNPNCNTNSSYNQTYEYFIRYELSKHFGLKLGIYNSNKSYSTVVLSNYFGLMPVYWGIYQTNVPFGYYYKQEFKNGKVYFICENDISIITPKTYESTFANTHIEAFSTHQERDLGFILSIFPGFGYNITKRNRLELSFNFYFRYHGQTHINNTYKVYQGNGNYEVYNDNIVLKKNSKIDFGSKIALTYTYMLIDWKELIPHRRKPKEPTTVQ